MSKAPNAKSAFGVDLAMNCATTNNTTLQKMSVFSKPHHKFQPT